MRRFKVLLFVVGMIFLVACNSREINTSNKINTSKKNNDIEVRGLVLKYALIDTAYEIYQVKGEDMGIFTEKNYEGMGKDTYNHYKWLTKTYNEFDEKMKR